MNARLKESYVAAENELPETAKAMLADVMDAFRATVREDRTPFSEAELASIRAMEETPDTLADPAEVKALFGRHGL